VSKTATHHHYLLEIGTEELPAGFLKTAVPELQEKLDEKLQTEGLTFEAIEIYSTPRRLTLSIKGLPSVQPDKKIQIKGPPKKIALSDSGEPTPAALGFCKKMNIDYKDLQLETLEDGEAYLVYKKTEPGAPTPEVLQRVLPELVLGLSGSHFMYWGESTIKFSRPIRWLVSLWDENHLTMQFGTLSSGNTSHGHRVLGNPSIKLSHPSQYLDILEKEGKVIADLHQRQALIWDALQKAGQKLGGRVPENPDLLETVTQLVEYPSVVVGSFEKRFLEIPQEVVTTVMAAHQKYFPVEMPGENTLLPYFLAVSNGDSASEEMIRHGNEKVLTARLEDARFFFEEDRKVSLASRVDALKGMTFQKGLGTMADKTNRLKTLTRAVGKQLGYDESLLQKCERSALLCKVDLLTGMVRELTELQGVMGRKYAQLEGEDPEVSEALFEHYLPRFVDDQVAKTSTGIALSLADKIDTLVAVFSQKNARLPSGSKDPLGLRRMSFGIIQTLLQNNLHLNLSQLFEEAYQHLGPLATAEKESSLALVSSFLLQRFKGAMLDQAIRYDVIDAVIEAGNPLEDLLDTVERIHQVKALIQEPETLKALYEPANRIHKILGAGYQPQLTLSDIDSSLFQDPSEGILFEAFGKISETQGYSGLVQALKSLYPLVENFFNQVLINDPNEAIRKNRHHLLSLLNRLYLRLALFTKLVV
jgi:glycyl-tRNA synthetase beta chain